MDDAVLVRLSGAAALIGGTLRIADAFISHAFAGPIVQLIYFATDLFLLFGLAGIYLRRSRSVGMGGFAGLVVTVLGILIVRSSTVLFASAGYAIGAGVTLVGLAVLSVFILLRRAGSPLAPLLWLAAVVLGLAGASAAAPYWIASLAGIVFGAGFVAAGIELMRAGPEWRLPCPPQRYLRSSMP
jgi:hypothetical protein